VHFIRNLLAHVPKGQVDMVAAVFRTIFAQPDPNSMAATSEQVRDQLAGRFPNEQSAGVPAARTSSSRTSV
jgi:transposase-like protein